MIGSSVDLTNHDIHCLSTVIDVVYTDIRMHRYFICFIYPYLTFDDWYNVMLSRTIKTNSAQTASQYYCLIVKH